MLQTNLLSLNKTHERTIEIEVTITILIGKNSSNTPNITRETNLIFQIFEVCGKNSPLFEHKLSV